MVVKSLSQTVRIHTSFILSTPLNHFRHHSQNINIQPRRPQNHISTTRSLSATPSSSQIPIATKIPSSRAYQAQPRTLYVVSTPIGHLGDLTPRALSILQSVDTIYAEDTRTTRSLLSLSTDSNSIPKPPIHSCHAHNIRSRIPSVISQIMDNNASIAVVCDAGTPCISDPGAELVEAAISAGIRVTPVPGACAAIAAVSVSGFTGGFTFVGFLQGRDKQRKEIIHKFPYHSVILYEAPHRLKATLALIDGCFESNSKTRKRKIMIGREVTKKWEEFIRFEDITHARSYYEKVEPRGEFTLTIGPVEEEKEEVDGDDNLTFEEKYGSDVPMDAKQLIVSLVSEGLSVRSISKIVAGCSNIPRKVVYTFASNLKQANAAAEQLSNNDNDD